MHFAPDDEGNFKQSFPCITLGTQPLKMKYWTGALTQRLLEEVKRKRGFYCSNYPLPVMILKRAISIIMKYFNKRYITWEYRCEAPDAVLEKEGGKSGAQSPSIQVPGRRLSISKAGSFLVGEVKEKCATRVLQPLLNLKSLGLYKI